ncbi:hypothetical protein [Acidihalobacter ferrooxydans]|uniref:hypothetical protein n=1 Tax=Acidihalobacter ferrooxydans TaxID=1765967 RepID=UPI0018DE7419|nr:hypothetical protein [Acidihalobacter ferrooxydans]
MDIEARFFGLLTGYSKALKKTQKRGFSKTYHPSACRIISAWLNPRLNRWPGKASLSDSLNRCCSATASLSR